MQYADKWEEKGRNPLDSIGGLNNEYAALRYPIAENAFKPARIFTPPSEVTDLHLWIISNYVASPAVITIVNLGLGFDTQT